MKLTETQTKWIFTRVNEFTDKYIKLAPLSDEYWLKAHDEIRNLVDKSRNNTLMISLLISSMQYLEKLQ